MGIKLDLLPLDELFQTRPVSESSPIKAELESLINNKIHESTNGKAIVIEDKSNQQEAEAQKAAVKAMESAFLKKKQAARNVNEEDNVTKDDDDNVVTPVPATRQSIRRKEGPRYQNKYVLSGLQTVSAKQEHN